MGNLELSAPAPRSPFPRRPIFTPTRSTYNNPWSRSVSPYALHSPRLNRSTLQPYDPYPDRNSSKSCIYTCPRMIRSVIKNTPYQENRSLSYIKSIKKNYQDHPYFRKPRCDPRDATPRQRYSERPMMPVSPGRSTIRDIVDFSKEYRHNLESEISNRRIRNQAYYQHQESIGNKSPRNPSASLYQQAGSARHRDRLREDVGINLKNCCNHACSLQPSLETDRSNYMEQALTQRKNQNINSSRQEKKSVAAETASKTNRYKEQTLEYSQCETLPHANQNLRRTAVIHKQNRQKCQQIIKRVRNFNQFLIEVKRKLKKQTDHSNNQSLSNISLTQQQNPSANTSLEQVQCQSRSRMQSKIAGQAKSITMALRLENEKIELEKYRKLVERELSKQHSIASIEIEGGRNKEKIIKIHLEQEQQPEPKMSNQSSTRKMSKQSSAKQAGLQAHSQVEQHGSRANIGSKQGVEQEDRPISYRVSSINKLMNKMEGLTRIQGQNYKQMYELLRDDQTANIDQ